MSELIFSKKQLKPLIEKYKINVNDNEYFKRIIEMFPEQTNYHIWAIKAIFSGVAKMSDIEQIKEWADKNPTHIKDLIKSNVVSYTNKTDFANLFREMEGIEMIHDVKTTISKFNTAQRAMLTEAFFPTELNGLEASKNTTFCSRTKVLRQFEKIDSNRKATFITKASAYTTYSSLWTGICDCLKASYVWNKEDMLRFVECNTKGVEIVYNQGDIVVLKIPTFDASHKICGSGRTGWCITRDSSYFKQYVTDKKGNQQYFFFDFSKKENDELAHVGFTVSPTSGICNAHSTHNNSMLGTGIRYNDTNINVNKLLESKGIKPSVYIRLKELKHFGWNLESFFKFLNEHSNMFAIAFDANNRLIISCLNNEALHLLCGHTFINTSSYVKEDTKNYVFIDFNLDVNEAKSLILVHCAKDRFGTVSPLQVIDAYGARLSDDSYLRGLGIKQADYINNEKIPNSILLHKHIWESNEQDAINLINDADDCDVNYIHDYNVPVYLAIQKGLFNVFTALINHPKFDCNTLDIFTENVFTSLLYEYVGKIACEPDDKNGLDKLHRMIDIILESDKFDYNLTNISQDNAINVSCQYTELDWVTKALLSKPTVNINQINDFNISALGNAIIGGNLGIIPFIAKRSDFTLRNEDVECAKDNNVNLSTILKDVVVSTVA